MKKKIKILFVLEACLGGTRKHVVDLLSNIDRETFDVTFIYSLNRADMNFYSDLEMLNKIGIKCINIEMRRNINLVFDLIAFIKLFFIIKTNNFDLVHTHSSKAGFLARIASKLVNRKIKTIYTPNSISINLHKKYAILEKFASNFTDFIIAVSQSEYEEIKKFKIINHSKLIKINSGVQYNPINLKNNILRDLLKLKEDTLIIASIGRLSNQKNPLDFFRICKGLVASNINSSFHFVWIGDGEKKDELDKYIAENSLNTYCTILGWRTDVEQLLWSVDIFILTSIYESFGYVTCEAMSHFVPVLGTNIVGTKDIIIDSVTGYLIDLYDTQTFVALLKTLVLDEKKRCSMGLESNKRIEVYFNLNNMVKSTVMLYKSIINQP